MESAESVISLNHVIEGMAALAIAQEEDDGAKLTRLAKISQAMLHERASEWVHGFNIHRAVLKTLVAVIERACQPGSGYRAMPTSKKLVALFTIDKCLKRYMTGWRHPRFFPTGSFLNTNQASYVELYNDVIKVWTAACSDLVKHIGTTDPTIDKAACKDAAERNTTTVWTIEEDI